MGVDAEEFPQQIPQRPNDKVDNSSNGYSASIYGLVDVPAKESSWEYDLDRENSNAAALLLCHTATPKLSLHPRGLRSVAAPVSFQTAATNTSKEAEQVPPNAKEPTEDASLTYKLMGAADKVVQFFSSLHPIEENRRFASHGLRQTLPNPKRLQPNELFERRQQDQLKQAALSLRDAIMKLITASGTTNAEQATYRLPPEIRSRFTRLRVKLGDALGNGQQPSSDPAASNLDRFASMCNYLAQVNPKDVDSEVRQEFISFSQRHAQDLESHCRTFKWLEEQQRVGRMGGSAGLDEHQQRSRVCGSAGLVRGMSPSSIGAVKKPSGLGAVREHYTQPR